MGRELNERLSDLHQLSDVPRGLCRQFRTVLEGVSRCQSGRPMRLCSYDGGKVKRISQELISQAVDVVAGVGSGSAVYEICLVLR